MKPFQRFLIGQTASNLGDAFGFVAMPLLVLELTHSVVQMGWVTAVAGAGQLIAALFSGAVVDRSHRRRLMIACDLFRVALYASLPIAASLGVLTMPMVFIVAALTAIASNLFSVAYMAAVANLVEPEEVSAANGRLQASQALTFVIGAALAGVVCAKLGPAAAMGVDAVSFLASALSLSQLTFRNDRALGASGGLFDGLRYLTKQPTLRALAVFQACVGLLGSVGIGAAVIDLIVYRLKIDFHENSDVVGACLAVTALGAVAGALLASRLRKSFSLGAIVIGGTATQALGLIFAGLATGLPLVMLGGAFWSTGLTSRAVAANTLRQTLTPDALIGRVVAAGWTLIFSASALGAVLVTRAAAQFGVSNASLGIGLALAAVTVAGGFSALGRASSQS